MKKEDKDLLLRDLAQRLTYLPKVHADDGLSPDDKGNDYTLLGINAYKRIALLGLDFGGVYATYKEYLDNIKPYLRSLSSMTDEEEDEYEKFIRGSFEKQMDFYLRKHFDFRGLIPKGLALEAPKDMYNEIKEE